MTVRIGHASTGENGIRNQIAGDGTGKEVCIRYWYSKPWSVLLRAKDRNIADKIADACEAACNNDHIGYDQNQRNTLKTQAVTVGMDLSRITKDCECDCSSLVTVCCECAGIKIPYTSGNAPTTSTLKKVLVGTGQFVAYEEDLYLTSDKYLRKGDILLKPGAHVVIVLDDCPTYSRVPDKYQYGIDVNEAQGMIAWDIVKAHGISFACLRSTKKSLNPDKYFERNYAECVRLKIDYSCFKYAYSTTEEDAVREADSVINLLHGRSMMVWYDVEDDILKSLSKNELEKIILAFIKECNLKGVKAGIYCSDDWYKNRISKQLKDSYMFWIARYGKNDGTLNENYKPSGECFAWQYTDKGTVPGIKGYVDRDVIMP